MPCRHVCYCDWIRVSSVIQPSKLSHCGDLVASQGWLSNTALLLRVAGPWLSPCEACSVQHWEAVLQALAAGQPLPDPVDCCHCIPALPAVNALGQCPCPLCGQALLTDNPVSNGWTTKGVLYGLLGCKEVVVCHRKCTNRCVSTKSFTAQYACLATAVNLRKSSFSCANMRLTSIVWMHVATAQAWPMMAWMMASSIGQTRC